MGPEPNSQHCYALAVWTGAGLGGAELISLCLGFFPCQYRVTLTSFQSYIELCSSRPLAEYLKFRRCPTLVIWIFCSKIQWIAWCPLLRKLSSREASRVRKESSGGRIFTSSKYTWPFGIPVLSPFSQGQRNGWQGGPERPSRRPLSELPGPWPWHRGSLHSALWSLCTCWACPHPGPLLAFPFSSFKRPQGGPRAQWLDSQVASQRPCCPIERPVESQGEREEGMINHEGWESRQDWIEVEGLFFFFFPGPVVVVVEASVLGHLPRHMLS